MPIRGISVTAAQIEYKTLRRDEHFFGLGEKTGKLDRRGEAYKMWNSDKPCYSTVEDPLYKEYSVLYEQLSLWYFPGQYV